jgi:fatty acid desaturase
MMGAVPVPDAAPLTAGDLLTLAELRDLRRTSAVRGAGLVAHAWAVIAGAMALYAAWPSWLTLAVAVPVIGGRQLGLAVLMHEAAHWLLFPGHPANARVGAWLCANPVGGDLRAYRRRHHLHHRHTGGPEDPDLDLGAATRGRRRVFWLGVARDLSGLTACAWVLRQRPWRTDAPPLRGVLLANAVLFGALAAIGQWPLYLLLWLLPLATWYPLAARLRELAEHGRVGGAGDTLRNARTTAAGWPARALLAPYWVNHHLEHHLLVFVPCWRLRDAHRLLLAKGHGPRMELAPGYAAVVRKATAT